MKRTFRLHLAAGLATAVVLVGLTTTPAAATDWGGAGGYDGDPSTCSGNIDVGAPVPVKAKDGRTVGYTQMRWSNGCQANWVRAWTVNNQKTTIQSQIFQSRPPGPDRRFAGADDYESLHYTMYIRAGAHEKMCGGTKMWDVPTLAWAFSGVYCRT